MQRDAKRLPQILYVEDDQISREVISMFLKDKFKVELATDSSEAITKIEQIRFDVILMDIHLPDLSGIEATKVIKETSPEIAIVALTINEDEEYFFKMLEAGASGYVPKRAAP